MTISTLPQPRYAVASPNRAVVLLATATVSISLFFYAFPGVDVSISRWFYSSTDGFALAQNPMLRLLRSSSTWVMATVVLFSLYRIGRLLWIRRPILKYGRGPLWLLGGLALGPGLMVNSILKEYWGRPRPVGTDLFGGEAPFQKAWVVSDWCDRNCSFVSGEASSAAWLVAAAFLAPQQIRPLAIVVATVYAVALSLNRIAVGGHYLSDVLLAWLLCAVVFLLLARWIFSDRQGEMRRRSTPSSVSGIRL